MIGLPLLSAAFALIAIAADNLLPSSAPGWPVALLRLIVVAAVASDLIHRGARAPRISSWMAADAAPILLAVAYIALIAFRIAGLRAFVATAGALEMLVLVRATLEALPPMARSRQLRGVVAGIVDHPAKTVALSFLLAILIGTFLLMNGLATRDGLGLPFVDALFTATSAVCVTGLIVVDTATHFTLVGQIVIVTLIQVGGLGIMVFTMFAFTLRRQAVTVESKFLLSYMLAESRMTALSAALKRIFLITLCAEAAGAIALFVLFRQSVLGVAERAFYAVFHSVSAFCNAGFALFTTSLEAFRASIGVMIVVSLLIIGGGISFAVLTDAFSNLKSRSIRRITRAPMRVQPLSVNTKAVLIATGLLLAIGFVGIYALEHGRSLAPLPTGEQYLAALFQSVTLRTAGFNTVAIGTLAVPTLLLMMVLMFVGGAAGSTAGGVKVNNAAVIVAHVRATRRGAGPTLLFGHTVTPDQIATAFSVLFVGVASVITGTFLLSLTESAELTDLLFESISAFATVGLSTGVTGALTAFGRIVITTLMFIGRVGPITLLAASSTRRPALRVSYPTADIATG